MLLHLTLYTAVHVAIALRPVVVRSRSIILKFLLSPFSKIKSSPAEFISLVYLGIGYLIQAHSFFN